MWITTLILTSFACANAKIPVYPINPIPPPYTPYLDSRPSFQFPGMMYYGIYLRRSAQPSRALETEQSSVLRQSRYPESPAIQTHQSIVRTKRPLNGEPNLQRQHARRLAARRQLEREGPRKEGLRRPPPTKPPAKPPQRSRVKNPTTPLSLIYDYANFNPYIYEPIPCPPGQKNVLDHCAAETYHGMCPSGTVAVNNMCVSTIIYPGKSKFFEEPIPW